MNDNAILDEVYAARQALWDEAGGTLDGLLKFLREHSIPGVRYANLPIARPRRTLLSATRKRTPRQSARKSNTSA